MSDVSRYLVKWSAIGGALGLFLGLAFGFPVPLTLFAALTAAAIRVGLLLLAENLASGVGDKQA